MSSELPAEPAPDAVSQAGRLKRWIRPLMIVIAAGFVALAARDIARGWEDSEVELAPALAFAACVPLFAAAFTQGLAWILLVERMSSRRVAKGPALSLYLASQLARYTPGKVGLPLVRMEGAPRLGLGRATVGVSVLVEMLSWTATGAVCGFALLLAFAPRDGLGGLLGRMSAPLLLASVLGSLLLLAVDRARYPARVRALVAPGGSGPIVPAVVPAVQLAYWALIAAHGYLMSLALGAPQSAAATAMGFYVIASVAGFVVLAAPAGLGVREAVLSAGLASSVGAAGALGAALVSRAASLLTEVLAWLLARSLWQAPPASTPTNEPSSS